MREKKHHFVYSDTVVLCFLCLIIIIVFPFCFMFSVAASMGKDIMEEEKQVEYCIHNHSTKEVISGYCEKDGEFYKINEPNN